MNRASAATSAHPVAAAALGEVAGEALEALGYGPDLAVLVAAGSHVDSLGSMVEAVGGILAPRVVLAVGSPAALGADDSGRMPPSVALWAATGVDATPVIATSYPEGGPPTLDIDALPASGTLVVVATNAASLIRLAEAVAVERPALVVAGGLLAPDGRVGVMGATDEGIAGVVLPAGTATVATAGAVRPVGDPMVVTEADGPVVASIAGVPAADHLDAVAAALGADDRRLLGRGVYLCEVVDERSVDPGSADVVAHRVRGLVAGTRSLAVDAPIAVGTLVRFGCLDPHTATTEWPRSLRSAADTASGMAATGALVFRCAARDAPVFGDTRRDVEVAAEVLGTPAVAAVTCGGELGPRGKKSWLMGDTAVAVVVHDSGARTLG